jgi:hypothetical protein
MHSACIASFALLLTACASVNSGTAPQDLGGGGPDDMAMMRRDAVVILVPHDMAMSPQPVDMADPGPIDMGPFPPTAIYLVSNKATGKYLSIRGSSTLNGAVTEERGGGADPDQRWKLKAAPSSSWQLINVQSNSCLDLLPNAPVAGGSTVLETCSTATSQQWSMKDVGGGFYNLINGLSVACIDLDHGNSADGTNIFQYQCNGGDNQKWTFVKQQ